MSITTKIVAPVWIMGLLLAAVAVWVETATLDPRFNEFLGRRASTLSHAVAYASENAQDPADVSRIVAALGTERDVLLIVVVGGEPARVVASTSSRYRGHDAADLPPQVRERVRQALASRAPSSRVDDTEQTFTQAAPLLVGGADSPTVAPRGAVAVVLDRRPQARAVTSLIWVGIRRKLLLIVCITLVALIAVRRFVFRPIGHITAAMDRFRAGDPAARAPITADDEVGRLSGILNEAIEARAQSELRVAQALERVELAVRGGNAGLWDWQVGSDQVYYSPHFKELLGEDDATMPDTVGALRSRMPEDDAALRDQALQAHLDGAGPFDVTIRVRHRDGSLRRFRERGEAVRNEAGTPVRVAGSFADVTARTRLEAELRAAKASAEQAVQTKSSFLATMSHEIRTPMNGVLGMADLLLSSSLTGEQRDCAETIQRSGDALLRIIDDILDLSKIEAGRLSLESTRFDLESAVDDVVDLLAEKARGRSVRVVPIIGRDVPQWVTGDPGRVRQILINLVGNAVKFTENGNIVIRVRTIERSERSITTRFDVWDSGIGVPEDVLPLLFQPYVQAETSTARRFGGTGLGLTISKRLAEQMGGTVGVESAAGRGSLFWFTVRFTGTHHDEASVQRSLEGIRVLVVADHDSTREAIEARFTRLGAHVLGTPGAGAHAVDRRAYDVVVLEDGLPGLAEFATASADAPGPLTLLFKDRTSPAGATGQTPEPAATWPWPVLTGLRSAQIERLVAPRGTADAPRRVAPPPATQPDTAGRRRRILVVEDNPTNQLVAVKMLQALGHTAEVMANGRLGLDAHARAPFDLILMDCQMPVMDGYDAARAIRQLDSAGRDVPIIAITANALEGDRERCLTAGMNDYLPKPLKRDRLRDAVERWLPAGGHSERPLAHDAV